jgi:serine/threonine protein kinase
MKGRMAHSATIDRIRGTNLLSSPGACSYAATHENCWLALKSQSTMLLNLQDSILHVLSATSGTNQKTLSVILDMIGALTRATVDDLFSLVDSTIRSVRQLPHLLQPKTEKLVHTFLHSLLAIRRLAQDIEQSSCDQFPQAEHPQNSSLILVCRICDTAIPAAIFEEHTQSCLALYQSQPTINSVNEHFSELYRAIGAEFLHMPWPGPRDLGVSTLTPALHIYTLCCWAARLDPSVSDTVIELTRINMILANWPPELCPALVRYVEEVTNVINEKIKISNAMCDAIAILRQHGSQGRPTAPTIASFSFIKRISRGATASVFLARKIKTGDIFAIKATPREALKQKNQAQRLLVEKDILLQFCHPRIVNFFYSIVGENNFYLVTEFVQGGDLYSLLQHLGSLDEKVTKFYAMELVATLRVLREHGICHRDIKPDNILIAADGHLKLTDFGLSFLGMVDRCSDSAKLMSEAKSFVGTPDYIAPEIILNEPHSFSVDYWSLGILIYELVYGDPPFHQDTEEETYRCTLMGILTFPDDVDVSPEYIDLVRRLLAVDPVQRIGHASIDEIASHPWFADIGPDTPPPFIPRLSSDLDTGYFEQRYAFNPEEDLSVLQDIQSQAPSSVTSFSSVGLGQLQRRNEEMAELSGVGTFTVQMHKSNSTSRIHGAKTYQPVIPRRMSVEAPPSRPSRVIASSTPPGRGRRQSMAGVVLQ